MKWWFTSNHSDYDRERFIGPFLTQEEADTANANLIAQADPGFTYGSVESHDDSWQPPAAIARHSTPEGEKISYDDGVITVV